jgi:hypothetical protein
MRKKRQGAMKEKFCPLFVKGKACGLPLTQVDHRFIIANYHLMTYQCRLGHRCHFLEPSGHRLWVTFEHRRYSAIYSVRSRVITVESEYGFATTQGGRSESVARRLFREILQGAKARGELRVP